MNPRLVLHRRFLAAALGSALTLAACGGSSGPTQSATRSTPEPRQPLSAVIRPFNAALTSGSCRRQAPFMFSIIRRASPGDPARSDECPSHLEPAPPPADARFTRAAEYGTGGIIEGTTGSSSPSLHSVALWALDGDGRYRYTGIYGTARGGSEIGSDPMPRGDGRAAADRFVAATRAGDCRKLRAALNPGGRLVKGTGGFAAACKTVLGGSYFAPAVRKSPRARPVELGLTHNFGFYGVAAGDEYFTIVLGNKVPKPRLTVLDVLPATPVSAQPNG